MNEKDSIQSNSENTSNSVSYNFSNSISSFKNKTRDSFKEHESFKRIETSAKESNIESSQYNEDTIHKVVSFPNSGYF